jgi:hypothetical protein
MCLKGGLPQLPAETAEIERRPLGRRVSGAEIFAAARDLDAAYAGATHLSQACAKPIRRTNAFRIS